MATSLTPSQRDLEIIQVWLAGLAGILQHQNGNMLDANSAKVLSRLLGKRLPSAAFNDDSLDWVVTGQRFFPTPDHIREQVGSWWETNKPAVAPRIEGPKGDELSAEDARALDSFRRTHDAPEDPSKARAPRGQALSFLHDRFPGAWKELMRFADNREAYENYINEGSPIRRPWNWRAVTTADTIDTKRRTSVGGVVRKVSDMMPRYQPSSKPEDTPKPMPAHLSPEQLERAYGDTSRNPRTIAAKAKSTVTDDEWSNDDWRMRDAAD